MTDELTALRTVLGDIARRRRSLAWRRGWTVGATVAAGALLLVRAVVMATGLAGLAFLLVVATGALIAVIALARGARPPRAASSPAQLARLLEERVGGLDDVVVSAIDYADRPEHDPVMAARLAGAAQRSLGPDPADAVVPSADLATAGKWALGASAVLALGLLSAIGPLTNAARVAATYLAPWSIAIDVEPGDVRVRAGRPVTIVARLRDAAALAPVLVAGAGPDAAPTPMTARADGTFVVTLPEVTASFPYHVEVGAQTSRNYTVTVVHPARVERIDLQYAYPPALKLDPRREEDGGDIYAPEGTQVSLAVTADRAVQQAWLAMADGSRVPLGVTGAISTGALAVVADGSYRITFTDDDGVEMPDDTEYFIRTLLDRPPDVRVLRPAGDKQVTPLEEVLIEARADDDFGVRSFDLVLQKPGDSEVVVPLQRGAKGLTVNGAHTLYLEDLEVGPGDVVSYYVRATDIGRGKPSSESRSDMYFLEIKAFNDEFVAAQSQAMAAGGQSEGVQDLAAAQKEIIVATWKLDSRGRRARSAGSTRDITTIAQAQRALEQRAAREAGTQLQGATGAAPRRRRGRATLNTVGEDPLGLAIEAMRRAAIELEQLKTSAAIPHEMEALNQLLRAESDVRRRQVARQQGGGGAGNRDTPDLSALFDQELRKQQQTNYETPASAETRQDAKNDDDPLEKLRELARRQEALSREQADLARTQAALEAEAVKRRLERLTREQEDLRRELEQLAKSMPAPNEQQREAANGQQQQGSESQPRSSGSQQQSAQASSQSGASGQPGASAGATGTQPSDQEALRDAVSEMRQASSGLRDQDAARASESAARALERMRRAEDALRGSTAGDLRQQLGDAQLEARQLAEAQRRMGEELRERRNGGGRDRELSREQARLAARAERLRQRLRSLADQAPDGAGRAAAAEAAREMDSGRTADLMREASRALDGAVPPPQVGAPPATGASGTRQPSANGQPSGAETAARLGADAARALDRVAERLDGRRTADEATARLSDDLARTRELREQLENVERSLEQLRAGERAQAEDAASRRAGQNGTRDGAGGQADRSASRASEIDRLQRQLAEDMREARAQVDALGRASAEMRGGSTPEEWQPSISAPGTEAFKQDFARWETLKRNLLVALEKVERGLADELRAAEARHRLNAGASEAVPDDYRRLVDKYYRALATPRRPGR